MAFHVACPITCRKICFCALGFPRKLRTDKGKNDFLQEVAGVDRFLNDPWLIKAKENATVQVKVPKVVASKTPLPPAAAGGAIDEAAAAQVKRAALQKQASAASVAAEDYARKFESGDLGTSVKDASGEDQFQSTAKVLCRLCFSGEYEGSERARKMLSCNTCGKKYHRSCLKPWSQNRDLFHWSSWTCPCCRTCEVCKRTGDQNKFMFCKRCDGAYHCYCQQPPHKNVGNGPYLCPKHTKCHSCGSAVPGNGLSVRWFLGYTCCDACGRLFVKGNYCPVCLKVYRDSESTPMVCCDLCQRWVHCPCDGISDAKYMQFQVDGNLQYVCPTCRGECCQVRSLEESVQELWRRKDEADKDLIASFRAAAGLPTHEEIFGISPFSDDEETGPVVKNEFNRSLKFSLKGLGEKSPKKNKEHGKKSSKKKSGKKRGNETYLVSGSEAYQSISDHTKNEEIKVSIEPASLSPTAGSLAEEVSVGPKAAFSKHKSIDEVSPANNITKTSRTIKIKSNKFHNLSNSGEAGISNGVPKTAPGPKLVIHLGGRSKHSTSPSTSESKRGQESASIQGHKTYHTDQSKGLKPIKFKNPKSEFPKNSSKLSFSDGYESISPKKANSVLGKRSAADDDPSTRSESEVPVSKRHKYHSIIKHAEDVSISGNLVDDSSSSPLSRDRKPSLKFKIPNNSNNGNQSVPTSNQNLLLLQGKSDITYTRGQRSKRRKAAAGDEEGGSQWVEDNTVKDFTDANWILQKLGKDAAGKRVEIHQASSNSWHRGTVVEVFEGTSIVLIALDDGKAKRFELGKQGVRFVSQKQKH